MKFSLHLYSSCTGINSCINQRTTRWSDRRKACGQEACPEAQRGRTQTPSTGLCDILPPTTAITGYAIGLRKLPADWQFVFCWCSNGSMFVTDYYKVRSIRRFFSQPLTMLTPIQIKPQSFESSRN